MNSGPPPVGKVPTRRSMPEASTSKADTVLEFRFVTKANSAVVGGGTFGVIVICEPLLHPASSIVRSTKTLDRLATIPVWLSFRFSVVSAARQRFSELARKRTASRGGLKSQTRKENVVNCD